MGKTNKKYRIRQDKFISFVLLLVVILGILIVIAKCSAPKYRDVDADVAAPVVMFFDLPSFFLQSPSQAIMPRPAVPKQEDPNRDVFENSAFIGNSCLEGLRNYGTIQNTQYFTKVGLNVNTVYQKSRAYSDIPIMEELWGTQFESIFLMFGENELGWVNTQMFIDAYAKLIDDIKERQPGAKIYVQSILPVSAEASVKNKYNANNGRIEEFNGLIKAMCKEKGIPYLDVAAALKDENGCLPDDAASDGIHPNAAYCQIWVDYMRTLIK